MADKTLNALLDRHGQTYADELGIDVAANTPSPLFRLLCFALLASTRISADIAVAAARALTDEGLTTAGAMADSTWRTRTDILNTSGYARYDESTSRSLGATAELLTDRYSGDLRKLRAQADGNIHTLHSLITECKGIGDVGAAIFFREVQAAWDELFPYADDRALGVADRLGLGDDPGVLAKAVSKADYPRLVAALVRAGLAGDDEVTALRNASPA